MSKEKIELVVDGGAVKSNAQLAQTLGPLKINIQSVLASINDKTASFKGMQVPVKLIVDTNDKSFNVEVGSPPVSQLVKKELSIEKGSAQPNLAKVANLGMEQVIKIAIMKKDSMMVRSLKAAVKNVIGTCNSLGILVEGKEAKQAIEEVNAGMYDELIKNEVIEMSKDKKERLAVQLQEVQAAIQKEQEKLKALEEAEKAAAPAVTVEVKPAEEKAGEAKPEAGKPAAGKETAPAKGAEPAKAAEKKPAEKKK